MVAVRQKLGEKFKVAATLVAGVRVGPRAIVVAAASSAAVVALAAVLGYLPSHEPP